MNSNDKIPKHTLDQQSILNFMKEYTGQAVSTPKPQRKHEKMEQHPEEWELIKRKQERAKQKSIQLHSKSKNQAREKPSIVEINMPQIATNTLKKRTPPSLEKDITAKKLHMESPDLTDCQQNQPTPTEHDNAAALEKHEARLLARIEGMLLPLQTGLDHLT